MKNLFKKIFPTDGVRLSLAGVSGNLYQKWSILARKSVSTTQNKAFVKK